MSQSVGHDGPSTVKEKPPVDPAGVGQPLLPSQHLALRMGLLHTLRPQLLHQQRLMTMKVVPYMRLGWPQKVQPQLSQQWPGSGSNTTSVTVDGRKSNSRQSQPVDPS
jgi:hypothetical protein